MFAGIWIDRLQQPGRRIGKRIESCAHPKDKALGADKVEGLQLRNTVTGEESKRAFTGLFVAIGHIPRSELVSSQVTLHEEGYVAVDGRSTRTNLNGVFACGDLVDFTYRQAITAAGSGCQAALDAEKFLSHQQASNIKS